MTSACTSAIVSAPHFHKCCTRKGRCALLLNSCALGNKDTGRKHDSTHIFRSQASVERWGHRYYTPAALSAPRLVFSEGKWGFLVPDDLEMTSLGGNRQHFKVLDIWRLHYNFNITFTAHLKMQIGWACGEKDQFKLCSWYIQPGIILLSSHPDIETYSLITLSINHADSLSDLAALCTLYSTNVTSKSDGSSPVRERTSEQPPWR